MKELGVDIETFSSVSLTKAGVHKYVESPDFEIMLFQWSEDGGPAQHVSPHLGEPIPLHVVEALTDPNVLKTAWNAPFERTCLARWLLADMPPEQWQCSMVLAATLGMPMDLDRAGRALKIKAKKLAGKAMRWFCIPCKPTKANGMRTRNLPHHDPALWREFLAYGDMDVAAEQEILSRCRKIVVEPAVAAAEREAWCLDQRANDKGVRIDLTLAENAVKLNAIFKARCHAEATELTGLSNPNSVKQLIGWLNQAEDLDLETLKKKQIPPLLASVDSDVVRRVLELRMEMAKTSTQKYVAMLNRACSDGFFRGGAQFYGARTGRWAHRGVQFGNLPHNKVRDILAAREFLRRGDFESLEMLWGVPSFILSQLIRTAFIPDDDDSEFIIVDFSAIEAVALAWLSDCKWRLDVFNGDGKIYEHSASRAFGIPWSEFQAYIDRKAKHPLRPKGKVIELACGYGGSEGALVAMGALDEGLKLEELKPMAYAWRDASPEIAGATWRGQSPGFWEIMNEAALGAVRTGRMHEVKHGIEFSIDRGIMFMRLPSGRKLAYMQPRVVEGKFGQPCIEFSGLDQITNQWTRIQTYGPKLTENCDQAMCRDLLRDKMLRIDKITTYRDTLRFSVHDELVLSIPRGRGSVSELEEIMAEPVSWAPGMPLRAEGFSAPVYRKEE
jgi:DNA polymerase